MKWILIIAFLGFMESKHSLPSHRHDTPCNYHVQWKVTLISSVQILSKKNVFCHFSDQDVRSPHKCKKLSKCIAFCHFSDQDHHTNLKRAKNQSKFC